MAKVFIIRTEFIKHNFMKNAHTFFIAAHDSGCDRMPAKCFFITPLFAIIFARR